MHFFKNILLFYNDEFAEIKDKVIPLVRKNQANLKIIDVFDKFDQYLEVLPPSSSIDELKELIISERRQEIMRHFKNDSEMSSQVSIVFKFGNPVVEIIKEVLLNGHDLVIKAATGNKTLGDRLFGNIAVKLLRKCPCPVLIVKPSETVSFQKILAPVDPEAISDTAAETAEQGERTDRRIMDISIFMTRLGNCHLDILHCWFLPGESSLAHGRARIAPDKLSHMKILAEKLHTQRIKALIDSYDLEDLRYSSKVLKGDPGEIIVDYAGKNDIDLIIMGTVGRSGLLGLLIGSTAEKVIERVNCSVLTIKPANFKSPITI